MIKKLTLRSKPSSSIRFWELDAARGIAIMMMISFHFLYDLKAYGIQEGFGVAQWPKAFWNIYSTLIGTSFLVIVGASGWLKTQYQNSSSTRELIWGSLKVLSAAALVTFFSVILNTGLPIYFGVLHCIGVTLLLMPLWSRLQKSLIWVAILILLSQFLVEQIPVQTPFFIWIGLKPTPMPMGDYFPLIPWAGLSLLGFWVARHFQIHAKPHWLPARWKKFGAVRGLRFLGRHSLLIYLVHQPALIGLLKLIGWIDFR